MRYLLLTLCLFLTVNARASEPVRILSIGASISTGEHLQALQERMIRAGATHYEFVGPVERPGAPKLTPRLGFGGMKYLDMLNGRSFKTEWQPGAREVVPQVRPDLILLMGGTNNIVSLGPDQLGPIQKEWSLLVDFLVAERPDAPVLIAPITNVHPNGKWAHRQPSIDAFNQWMQEEIARRAAKGQRLYYVSEMPRLAPEDFREDGLHPVVSGQIAIGEGWFQALKKHQLLPYDPNRAAAR
ncbi:MAG TPA: GDSL-type esterase/lipase family protein [Chthoniobacteraceae bacterium]|nr:GDSL-type esterase/lipase family protein [Chthoniobacteraceae bacterium]